MYKNIALSISILLLCLGLNANAQDNDPYMGIVPAPVSVKKASGEFILGQQTILLADSLNNKAVNFFTEYIHSKLNLRNDAKINTGESVANSIVFTEKGTEGLPDQGYRLTITPQQVIIAGRGAGLFYGIQTLLQLIPVDHGATIKLQCAQIEDYPRFGYRGFMLDVCRHFFSVEFVKKTIDMMAYYKLNNFHWHLTDDQGWRIEIKKYPRLTEIGSKRAQTVIGNYHDRTPQQFDNTPYGGFYTQDQIREVVKYAADRYITVVPEIEMPGHSMAALAAYPELSCDPGKTYKTYETWGVVKDVYCPSDKTFDFLQDVLTEVMELFPSRYIHIGGDEVPKEAWKNSAFCQKLIKKLKLKNEEELQSYFIQRIEKFVNSKGRSIIGWDEILEGGLSPNATVMSWRGEEGGIAAARQGHNVIMTPGNGGLYLDHAQSRIGEPLSIGGYTPLSATYSYNPTPAALNADQQKFVMGVQANLWTEYIPTEPKVEYMLYPRLLALSEVAWSPLANKNFKNFSEARLPNQLAFLDKNNYNYRVPSVIGTQQDTIMFGSSLNVALKSPVAGAKIYYTIDSYTPRETDIEYHSPMTYDVPQDQYRDLQTIVITPSGKRSQVTHTVMYNKAPLAPVAYQGNATGLKYQYMQGTFTSTNDLTKAAVIDSGIAKSFNLSVLKKNNPGFGVIYNGFIRIDADGLYQFSTRSDDGSVLVIDDQPVVNNDGKHPIAEQGGAVALQKGYHKFTLKYFDAGAVSALRVYMTTPGKPKGELSPDALYN
ncbi:family 20 glycosylhydrolase [Mucilaginibacter sp. BT774]|uniref:family 20 glycosylhydrolase n=1 Tax=Mucilaginibacter sp. BT774 TaxID=3062276 RepID=UPI00267641D8|nr:family 20 glycosylhydrolase [Mucilaginibacter sp. BT774]MDO3627700.1 family 20 glycosylhydrolase [Mucilaginibacter sp. BT774]